MPPKKNKTRKRASFDDDGKDKEEGESKPAESTELLSPSEVVKMRKKSRPTVNQQVEPKDTVKETKQKGKTSRGSSIDKGDKKGKPKDVNDKKEKSVSKAAAKKVENTEDKRLKSYKEKRKYLTKKKSQSDDEENEAVTIMYPCGICTKEVSDADEAILCEAGCEFWYHRNCTGMTDIAYQFLTNEENCEWVCDKCIATKSVPLVKINMQNTT